VVKNWRIKVFDVMAYDKYTLTSIRDLDFENKSDLITVKAQLKMKKTEDGGRKTGFISGYRPNHVFEYKDGQLVHTYIGDIKFDGQDLIQPGEEKLVTVRFLLNQPIEKYINVGRKWWIHEGLNVIGEAEIVAVEV
jgi:translation elongation factor EF-Tu-like GTPase